MIEKQLNSDRIKATNGSLVTKEKDNTLQDIISTHDLKYIENEIIEIHGNCPLSKDNVTLDNEVSRMSKDTSMERYGVFIEKETESASFLTTNASKDNEMGGFRKLLLDKHLRHKLLHTSCVCLAKVALGWRQSMTGPTLPDLRLITNESLSRISWMISAIALGGPIGCFLCGYVYDRFNKYATFIGLLVALAAVTAATPWCLNFVSMVTIHVLNGIFTGGIDTVVAADVVFVWGTKSAPFLHAVSFAFSIGATLSPVTSEPFMAKPFQDMHVKNASSDTYFDIQTTAADTLILNISSVDFIESKSFQAELGQSNIYIAFTISAAVSCFVSLCFVLVLFLMGNVHQKTTELKDDVKTAVDTNKTVYPLSRGWKIVFICVMSLVLSIYVICERHFYNYLTTYLVERLRWTTTQGSKATTLFWFTFATGRLISVFLVRVLKLIYMFCIFLSVLISAELVMYLGVIYGISWLVWLSFVLHGLGMSALFANSLSWLSTKVCPLTGKVTCVVFTIMIIGPMLSPLIAGNIMVSLSYDWFIFLEMILTCLFTVSIIFVEVLYNFLTK